MVDNATMRVILSTHAVDVNAKDCSGYTALIIAAMYERTELAHSLLAHAADLDVNAVDADKSRSALHHASRSETAEVVRLLLDTKGININLQDRNGYTPLNLACFNGNTEAVSLLLGKPGVDVNVVDACGNTAMHQACRGGCLEDVQLMLGSSELDINVMTARGTPLHEALRALQGGVEVVQELLSRQPVPDVNATDQHGNTPLHLACQKSTNIMAKLLLGVNGIKINAVNHEGKIPLAVVRHHYANMNWRCIELEDLLLAVGAL